MSYIGNLATQDQKKAVVEFLILKEKILGYFDYRNEQEVIVLF